MTQLNQMTTEDKTNDIESQIKMLDILRQKIEENLIHENTQQRDNDVHIIKIFIIILIIILNTPLIICDLYYSYTDNSCVNKKPQRLDINMKTYLLTDAYTNIIILIGCIIFIIFVNV